MIVVELARPMLSLDAYFQGIEIQWEHFQINNNLNPASKGQFHFFKLVTIKKA